MSVERNLIITILKLTQSGATSQELINLDAKVPSAVSRKLLERMQSDGLVYVRADDVDVDALQRLKLAVRAIGLGIDSQRVSSFLGWQEFESIAAFALEQNGYIVRKNLRFKHGRRRREIDVVACRKPVVLCVDCKHWKHSLSPSTLRTIAEEQAERTRALVESLPSPSIKLECAGWDRATFYPLVLSLVVGRSKFHEDVPVVPILQLQDFLMQFAAYADSLEHFPWLRHEAQDRLLRETDRGVQADKEYGG